jgi:hypothetical protein
MLPREWRSLAAALAFLIEPDEVFVEAVEQNTENGISLSVTALLVIEQRTAALGRPPFFGKAALAWENWLRPRGADNKIAIRGIAVDRSRPGGGPVGVDGHHVASDIPAPEIEFLKLWDDLSQNGEKTYLRHDRLPFGQGRYWWNVTIHWPSFMREFELDTELFRKPELGSQPPNKVVSGGGSTDLWNPKSKSPYADEIWKAARSKFPDGIPSSFGDAKIKRYLQPILQKIKELKLPKDGTLPTARTYGRILKGFRRT